MLTIAGLTYRIAGRTLIEGASAQLGTGQRVGLVGRNGAGKSTLLALVRGALQPDAGSIETQRGARLGHVAQEAPGGEETPLDWTLAADTERAALLAEAETASDPHRIAEIHERLVAIEAHSAPARAAAILAGLGVDAAMQAAPLSALSGGWRMRVALAAVLFAEPELLLLDEPTNHLDLEAALWLEDFLRSWPSTMVVVSHDRRFLNGVATHILHLENRRLFLYPGDYDRFVRTRAERIERDRAMAAQQEKRRAHLQSFVDRFRAKASKARQAQSRLKALAKLPDIIAPPDDPEVAFDFPEPDEMAPPLLAFDKVAVGYKPGEPVLRGIGVRLDPDDRIALLGANGNGKSTLSRLLAGRFSPMAGEARRPGKLRVGFFAQHQIEELDPAASPLEHMARLMPGAGEAKVRAVLGRFGFSQDKALVKAASLSGGEKARLTLALVTYDAPHLLVLDEPTNHLDIEAREALVAALAEFGGAVVLVSHDWHLVELVADRLWLVADGAVRPFEGDLDDYRRHLAETRRAALPGRDTGPSRKDERRAAAEKRREIEPLRRRARDAERLVERLGAEKGSLERRLAEPALYEGEAGALVEALRRQGELQRQLEAAETAWLEAAEAVERAIEETGSTAGP